MYEILKKESRKNTPSPNSKGVNRLYRESYNSCNQQQIINELPIKYNVASDEDISTNKDRSVVQMKLYNSTKKSDPVENLDDLNAYIEDVLFGEIKIEYSMFGVEPEKVDAAIRELDPLYVSEENIIQAIIDKINELIVQKETKNQMEENEEKERIKTLFFRLKNMFQEYRIKGQKGFFVGDKSKWHIHTGIKDVHLRSGNGDRWDINNKNKRSIKDAADVLIKTGILGEDKKQCYCWLRYKMIEWFDEDLPKEQRVDL